MWLYLCGLTLGLAYVFMWHKQQYWKRRGVNGPPPSFWGMGHTVDMLVGMADDTKGLKAWNKEFKGIYGIYGFWIRPALVVTDAEMIKEITIKQFSRFPTRGRSAFNTTMGKMSKDFITVLEGNAWKRARTTITPFFSGARLSEMTPMIQNAANSIFSDQLDPSILSGDSLECKELTQIFTMTCIMSTGFNIDAKENKDLMTAAMKHGRAFMDSSFLKAMLYVVIPERVRFYFDLLTYPRETDNFFRNLSASLYQNAKEAREKGEKVRPSFISLMSDHIIDDKDKDTASKGFTMEELVAQSLIFIIAGFDTTATVLQFWLYAMATFPDVQEEIFNEINNEVAGELTYENIKKLKIVDASIKETQRLYSTLPILLRECDETTTVRGVTVEKGQRIVYNLDDIHHSEVYYSEPKTFNPHRFDGQESNTLQDDRWFAFGSGPRGCPGVRWAFVVMKIFIIQLMKHYKIVKTDKTLEKEEWKMTLKGQSIAPDKPLMVGFEKRI